MAGGMYGKIKVYTPRIQNCQCLYFCFPRFIISSSFQFRVFLGDFAVPTVPIPASWKSLCQKCSYIETVQSHISVFFNNMIYLQPSPPPPLPRSIRFLKFLSDFAPGVSTILFCILKILEEVSEFKVQNCLDAKWPVLLYKIMICD